MLDMNGNVIKVGDTLVARDTLGIHESVYTVSRLGAFDWSDIIVHPIYHGKEYPNFSRYLNSFWAALMYQVVEEQGHESVQC